MENQSILLFGFGVWLLWIIILVAVLRWVFVNPITKRLDQQIAIMEHVDRMIGQIRIPRDMLPPG